MKPSQPIYAALAGRIQARINCADTGNSEWHQHHTAAIEQIADDLLPCGSGIDAGCTVDFDKCGSNRIVIQTSFHHTDGSGCYDGWTKHQIIVKPTFSGIDIRVTGKDRNGVKDYLGDVFHDALTSLVVCDDSGNYHLTVGNAS